MVRLNRIRIAKNQSNVPLARRDAAKFTSLVCIQAASLSAFASRNDLLAPTETDPPPRRISRADLTGINPGRDMISGSVGSPNGRGAQVARKFARAPDVCVRGAPTPPIRKASRALRGTLARRSSLCSRECDVHVCMAIYAATKRSRRHSSSK